MYLQIANIFRAAPSPLKTLYVCHAQKSTLYETSCGYLLKKLTQLTGGLCHCEGVRTDDRARGSQIPRQREQQRNSQIHYEILVMILKSHSSEQKH